MTPTRQMMARIEDIGYQFLRGPDGWAAYDVDDRSEVRGSRAKALGDSIWQVADMLGLKHEGEA